MDSIPQDIRLQEAIQIVNHGTVKEARYGPLKTNCM